MEAMVVLSFVFATLFFLTVIATGICGCHAMHNLSRARHYLEHCANEALALKLQKAETKYRKQVSDAALILSVCLGFVAALVMFLTRTKGIAW